MALAGCDFREAFHRHGANLAAGAGGRESQCDGRAFGDLEGVLEDDVIVGYGNQPVASIDTLHRLLTDEQVHARAALTVLRHGEKRDLAIEPEEFPERASA